MAQEQNMSFNSSYTEKYLDHRVQLCSLLRPQQFLNELQSKTVLSNEDREEILNEQRNPTTTAKMGVLLDILKTKGPRGYNIFVGILGRVNEELYETITGQKPPVQDTVSPDFCTCTCHWGNIDDLTKLTESLKRQEQLHEDVKRLKATNSKQAKQNKEQHHKLKNLWTQYEVEQDKNQDRDRLEAERNEMMEQFTNVTVKALNYKEELDVANNNLHQIRLDFLRVKRELATVQQRLQNQRQKSIQIERSLSNSKTLMKNKVALEEKVAKLKLQLCQVDRADSTIVSVIQGNPSTQNETGDSSYVDEIQAALDIMRSDRDEAISKGEDAVSGMYKAQKELHSVEEKLNHSVEEIEDLLMSLETQRDETEMQKTFAAFAEEQLARAVEERTQALAEKNIQTGKCARLMLERDKLTEQQRKLRAEMTCILEKNTSSQSMLTKYKKKLRKLSGRPVALDKEESESSSFDFTEIQERLNINDPETGNQNILAKDQDEDFRSMAKRDSSTTDDSYQTTTTTTTTSSSNPMHGVSSLDSEEDLPIRRQRANAIGYVKFPRRKISAAYVSNPFKGFEFPSQTTDTINSGTSSTEEENPSKEFYHEWKRFQNESTKVHCDGNSIRNANILLRSTNQSVPRRQKKKDRKNGMRPRSKSFNDLPSFSLEDDICVDLELDMAFQDQDTSRRSSRLINWFTIQKHFQRQEQHDKGRRSAHKVYIKNGY